MPEAMHLVLLCTLEAVEGELYAPRIKEPSKIADVCKRFRYSNVVGFRVLSLRCLSDAVGGGSWGHRATLLGFPARGPANLFQRKNNTPPWWSRNTDNDNLTIDYRGDGGRATQVAR